MRLGGEPVGRWGIALLTVAGVAGLLLAWHGWTGRAAAVAPPLAGAARSSAATAGTQPASSPAPATQGPTAGGPPASAAATPAPSAAATGSSHLGPTLSSQPFASSAFQIWPGPMSAAARQALTGLSVSVRKQRSGLSVIAGVNGQPPAPAHLYVGGVKVYVVEASMGDDSGNSDYSLGDDGLVVTNAQGRIIQ
jgi:hypothetical protein